jgi:putative ABC transport system substrate-binding protein
MTGLLVASDVFLFGRRGQTVLLAVSQKIPAIYYPREFAQAGGLMTYGNRVTDAYRQAGIYVVRLLRFRYRRDSMCGS